MIKEIQCSRCGSCIRECNKQMGVITLTDKGVEIELDECNKCGHCVAVCPTDSMDHPLSPRQELVGEALTPEDAEMFLRSARTVRYYKDELVPHEKMQRLLDIGRYAQTGANTQGISYIVIEGKEKIENLHKLFNSKANEACRKDPSLARLSDYMKRQEEQKSDIVFRDAPELILALSDIDNVQGKENAQFSLTFIALLAPTLGIGTCWAGIFELLATRKEYAKPFLEFAGVPEGKRISGAMMAGIPDVKFRRLVARDPLSIEWR